MTEGWNFPCRGRFSVVHTHGEPNLGTRRAPGPAGTRAGRDGEHQRKASRFRARRCQCHRTARDPAGSRGVTELGPAGHQILVQPHPQSPLHGRVTRAQPKLQTSPGVCNERFWKVLPNPNHSCEPPNPSKTTKKHQTETTNPQQQ